MRILDARLSISTMGNSDTFRDESRSRVDLAIAFAKRNSKYFAAAGLLYFGSMFLLGVSIYIHAEITQIAFWSEVVSRRGRPVDVDAAGLLLTLGIIGAATFACLHELLVGSE